MSGRGDRGRARGRGGGAPRGRGDSGSRGSSPAHGTPRGASPSFGSRGSSPAGGSGFRGGRGEGFRGGGAPRGRGGVRGPPPEQVHYASEPIPAPPEGPATIDARINTMQLGVEKFKKAPKSVEHPLRPGFGSLGAPIVVRANFFALKIRPGLIIHEYRVDITPKTDINRLKARILACLEDLPAFAQYKLDVAHDKSEKLVANRALPQPLDFEVTFVEEGETTPRPNAKTYKVEIVKTAELDTKQLTQHVGGDLANKDIDINPIVSAINLIIQMQSSRTGIRVGRNRHFFGPPVQSIGNGVEAWRGYYASVRPAWNTMMVNINVCMTAFVESKNLGTAIAQFMQGSYGAVPTLSRMFQKSNLKVKTLHLGYRKPVRAILGKTPDQQTFECKEMGGTVTVAEYFKKKYPNNPIEYPHLPLVDIGTSEKPNYIPAELCQIIRAIPFRGKLDDRQTSDMLRVACQSPKVNSNLIRGEGFDKLDLISPHETMKHFGISIDRQMTVIPARILPPPGINYAAGKPPRVNDGSWNILDVKFHRPGQLGVLTMLIVREESRPGPWTGPGDQNMWDFVSRFAQKCRNTGIQVSSERPVIEPTETLPPYHPDRDPSRAAAVLKVKMALTKLAQSKPRVIFVLLNARDNYIYPAIKRIGDVELGIQTICMQLDKAIGRGDHGKQDQYFSNVALKVNTKLGGVNHRLERRDLQWLLEKRTMVVGADVTHPGPTSIDGTPSLAAVVASVDADFFQFPVSMELQEGKKEMIQNLEKMMVDRLLLYQLHNKALPERVLFFRDGVSEGQFDSVLVEELPQIRKAFERVYKGGKKPQLMICICGKRHHARFYPTDDRNASRNGNTKPGTIVDKGIGDVYRFDFYLQAHAGLQGTVKATHYTVIYDEIGFSADTIQQGAHTSSYSYVRATKAVSLIPAAYYSDLACERGRLYLNDFLNLGTDRSSVGGRGKKDRDAAKREVFEACIRAWGDGIHAGVKNSMFYI